MSGSRGYDTYRGRKPVGKILLAIFLVLVIVGSVGFLLLQDYIVYDDSGRPHLELPGDTPSGEVSSEEGNPAPPDEDLEITIQQPQKPTDIAALQLPDDPAAWAGAAEGLAAAGHNALCVTVKETGGRVRYASSVAGAPLHAAAAAASEALPGLLAGDAYAVARLSCLRDSVTARANVDAMGLKNTGGYLFYDGNNENWLDPAKPAVRDYLCALVKECAALGFDEILLTDFSYPTVGKLNKIDSGGADQTRALAALLTALDEALADTPEVKLSLELSEEAVTTGLDSAAGWTLADLAPLADRIYVRTTAAKVPALSAAISAESEKTDFVPELTGETLPQGSWLSLQ